MKTLENCLFCKFVSGELPCHTVWEDEKHLAFLTIFPNTEGFTVVIPKEHHDSYFAEVNQEVRAGLVNAAATVSKLLDAAFDDVGRTGLMFEGFGVDHLHAKLFPMHGTVGSEWRERPSPPEKKIYFKQYQGYISSHDAAEADQAVLAETAAKIRAAQGK